MNILHIIASDKYSGAGAVSLTMVRSLIRRGHQVSYLCYSDCRLERMAGEAGCQLIQDINLRDNTSYGWNYLFPGRLRDMCKVNGIEVIHTHRSRDHSLIARCFSGVKNRPAIVRSWHQGTPQDISTFKRRLLASADRILVANKEVAECLLDTSSELKNRLTVLQGGVDSDMFAVSVENDSIRRTLGVPPDGILVGMISRLKPGRGHEVLIDAAGRLPDEAPVFFVLIGSGELEGKIRRSITEGGLGHRIKVFSPGTDYVRTLASLDLAVQLEPGSDGSCRAVLECMTMGVPVIAPRSGTFAEIIDHANTGFLINPPLAGLLAAAITRLATDQHLRASLSQKARAHAAEHYNLAVLSENLLRIYDRTLDGLRKGSSQ